jgi:ribosomal protein S18 acetylase RimI-like enzyme
MTTKALNLRPAAGDDFGYIYDLCEATMRAYVETAFGDRFEAIARPTIQNLLGRGLFSKIYVNDVLVGAIAFERHDTHFQLEELYIEAASQNQGIGTMVMKRLFKESLSLALPIRLNVLASNGARHFYEKLGFALTRSTTAVNFMEYRPPGIVASVV